MSSAAGFGGSGACDRSHARARGDQRARGQQRAEDPPLDADRRAGALDVGLVEQPPDEQQHAQPPASVIATPSPPGRWKPCFCERAQTRKRTATATSRIAASTNVKTPSADTLPCDDLAVLRTRLLVPGQHERERQRDRRGGGELQLLRQAGTVPCARLIGSGCPPRRARSARRAGRGARSSSRARARIAISSSRSASASWRGELGRERAAGSASTSASSAVEVREGVGRRLPGAALQPLGGVAASAARAASSAARVAPRARAARRPRRPRGRAQPCSNPTISEPSSSVADGRLVAGQRARAARSCACGRRRGRSARARSS